MSISGSGALGGAATGAGTGAMIGGPYGAIIGGAAGGLIGLFSGSDDPEYPELSLSPETLQSVNFRDIGLDKINPDLYNEIMRNRAIINETNKYLAARGDGNSPLARRRITDSMQQQEERLGGMGLTGTPAGEAMLADARARLQESASEQAYRDKLLGYQTMSEMGQRGLSNVSNAINSAQQNAQMAHQNALDIDKLRNAAALGRYQGDLENSTAQNQFNSGLFNSGLQNLGNMANANMQKDYMSQMYPSYQPKSYAQYMFGG